MIKQFKSYREFEDANKSYITRKAKVLNAIKGTKVKIEIITEFEMSIKTLGVTQLKLILEIYDSIKDEKARRRLLDEIDKMN